MSADGDSDEALMLAYGAGDASSFVRLYDRHERPVHRFFLRQSIAGAQADDLLQETWMAVVRSAPTYAAGAKFTTWLYTIARSKLVDHWRASRRYELLDDAANDPDDGDAASWVDLIAGSDAERPDVQAMSRQHATAFVAAVEALPAAQREAFLLHVNGELSLDEVAAVTGVGAETAKSRLRYAMRRMRVACSGSLDSTAAATRAGTGACDER